MANIEVERTRHTPMNNLTHRLKPFLSEKTQITMRIAEGNIQLEETLKNFDALPEQLSETNVTKIFSL